MFSVCVQTWCVCVCVFRTWPPQVRFTSDTSDCGCPENGEVRTGHHGIRQAAGRAGERRLGCGGITCRAAPTVASVFLSSGP